MRRRRGSDDITDSLIVVTSDGTRLRCSLAAVGRGDEPRWMLVESSGDQHVGPIAVSGRSPEEVTALIQTWWADHKNASPSPGKRSD